MCTHRVSGYTLLGTDIPLDRRQQLRSTENSYAMSSKNRSRNGDRERTAGLGGISVTRDVVRVADGPDNHATPIKWDESSQVRPITSQRVQILMRCARWDRAKGRLPSILKRIR